MQCLSTASPAAGQCRNLAHRPDVSPRASAERPLSPVPSDRCRGSTWDGPDIDAELIVLTWRLWGELGIRCGQARTQQPALPSRAVHREALVEFLSAPDKLDCRRSRRLTGRVRWSRTRTRKPSPWTRRKWLISGQKNPACTSRAWKARLDAAGIPYDQPEAIRGWITAARPFSNGSPTSWAPRATCAGVVTGY